MKKHVWPKWFIGFVTLTLMIAFVVPVSAKTWKIAVGDSGGSPQEQTGLKFAEILERETNGKYKATLFLNGQLWVGAGHGKRLLYGHPGFLHTGHQQHHSLFSHRGQPFPSLCYPEP